MLHTKLWKYSIKRQCIYMYMRLYMLSIHTQILVKLTVGSDQVGAHARVRCERLEWVQQVGPVVPSQNSIFFNFRNIPCLQLYDVSISLRKHGAKKSEAFIKYCKLTIPSPERLNRWLYRGGGGKRSCVWVCVCRLGTVMCRSIPPRNWRSCSSVGSAGYFVLTTLKHIFRHSIQINITSVNDKSL